MSTTKDSNQQLTTGLIVAIVLLCGLVAFFAISSFNKGKSNKALGAEKKEIQEELTTLQDEYDGAIAELETLQDENEELDLLLEQQKEEISQQKEEIERLIRDGKNLAEARRQVKKLKAQVGEYVSQINQLKEQNDMLASANEQLTVEKSTLTDSLSKKSNEYESVLTAKAVIEGENENLQSTNLQLSKKVNRASVVKVNNVSVEGQMLKKNGKAVSKNSADKVERLKICFDATANEVTNPGIEEFYIRIINPQGETVAIEGMGSGITTNVSNNEQIRYTQIKELDYSNSETQACSIWTPGTSFQKGIYEVEVYNKGYLAGTGSFRLK